MLIMCSIYLILTCIQQFICLSYVFFNFYYQQLSSSSQLIIQLAFSSYSMFKQPNHPFYLNYNYQLKQKSSMSSALELQKKLQILLDQVKDIFHATSINIEALGVQMAHKNTPKQLATILENCSSNLQELKKLIQERSMLRLNYLITEQIKEQEAKVRRQRLAEYEDKILDQRRLISDKQAFYENLLRPKKKRPPHMTLQQFQETRRRQISQQQNRKFNMLKNQVTKLDQFYQLIKRQNDKIEQALNNDQKLQQDLHNRYDIADEIKNSQVLYNSLSQSLGSSDKTSILNEVLKSIQDIKIQNDTLMKQYLEQKEMQQYLRWQKQKLIKQYNSTRLQLKKCRQGHLKQPKPLFQRPVSR